jgi:hypothetical protein
MESTYFIKATEGFFVRGRGPAGASGIVNPGETVSVSKSEAMDITAANRGVKIEQREFEAGPKADFIPKDAEGKPIPAVTMTRAQMHAAARAQMARLNEANTAALAPPQRSGKESRAA